MPKRIFAQVSPLSAGGASLFESMGKITSETVVNFRLEQYIISEYASILSMAGFEILHMGNQTINLAGSRTTYEKTYSKDFPKSDTEFDQRFSDLKALEFVGSAVQTGLPCQCTVTGNTDACCQGAIPSLEMRLTDIDDPVDAYFKIASKGNGSLYAIAAAGSCAFDMH
jgi:hypothetical protein